jgi:hypothetical protein
MARQVNFADNRLDSTSGTGFAVCACKAAPSKRFPQGLTSHDSIGEKDDDQ